MDLPKLGFPNLDAPGMRTEDKIRLINEYLYAFEKNVRFVLSNLETDNLGTELTDKLNRMQVAGEGEEGAAKAGGTVQSVNGKEPDEAGNVALDAADVSARPSDWMPSAADVGALPASEKAQLLLSVYPVGSIYMSVNAVSPAVLFGGTWEQLKDRFLLGAGGSYSAGAAGGSASHQHKYGFQYGGFYGEIALEQAANGGLLSYSTSNAISVTGGGSMQGSASFIVNGSTSSSNMSKTADYYRMTANTSYVSNMPPYLAVYMWKRVS